METNRPRRGFGSQAQRSHIVMVTHLLSVGEANAAEHLAFSLQVSLSESRLPQTSAVSGLESTQVSKIRKLPENLDCLHLLKGGFLTK